MGMRSLESAMQPWQLRADLIRANEDQLRRDTEYAFHHVHLHRRLAARILNRVPDWRLRRRVRAASSRNAVWNDTAGVSVRITPVQELEL